MSSAPSAHTLARAATLDGVGLFTGVKARVTIRPAAAGSGIAFRRVDLSASEGDRLIAALATHVVAESRRTVLAADPDQVRAAISAGGPAAAAALATVQTVEHLLSALAGLGISSALVELDGPEVPIADGSAAPFVAAILAAGSGGGTGGSSARAATGIEPRADKPPVPPVPPAIIREPIRLADSGSLIEALPLTPSELAAAESGSGPAAFYSYHLDYSNFPIAALAPTACRRVPPQRASIALPLIPTAASRDEYARSVAPARTFCLAEEAQAMRQAGLFAHLTPRDMLVIGDDGPIDNAYRFPADEPARHKLLDLIGDLALAGRPILGRITATRTGHAHNHALARRLMDL